VTPSAAPALRGWTPVSVARDGDALVYTYTRDASVTPQRPTAAKFGAGIVREAYSDSGRTMTVHVRRTARE